MWTIFCPSAKDARRVFASPNAGNYHAIFNGLFRSSPRFLGYRPLVPAGGDRRIGGARLLFDSQLQVSRVSCCRAGVPHLFCFSPETYRTPSMRSNMHSLVHPTLPTTHLSLSFSPFFFLVTKKSFVRKSFGNGYVWTFGQACLLMVPCGTTLNDFSFFHFLWCFFL